MAKVKYGPVEIDGENVLEQTERLLVAEDVDLDLPQYQSDNVKDAFVEVDDRIDSIETGDVSFDSILTANFEVLVDFNGNVLTKGF